MIGCSAGGAALSTLTPSTSERRSGKWTRAWRIGGSVIANAIGNRFAVRPSGPGEIRHIAGSIRQSAHRARMQFPGNCR